MPERFRPGCSVFKRGSGEDTTTDSHLPSSGSSLSCATHLSLQDIADRLHLARPTVKTHVASIYGKLGVTCRSDAVEVIEQAGLESTEAKVTIPGPELDWLRDAESPSPGGATISAIFADATSNPRVLA